MQDNHDIKVLHIAGQLDYLILIIICTHAYPINNISVFFKCQFVLSGIPSLCFISYTKSL